jgi:hypothetical protein
VWQYGISDVKLFSYIQDLAQSDFWFAALKKHLKGINFTCDEAVPPAAGKWFQEQPQEFYSDRFKKNLFSAGSIVSDKRETMW